MIRLLFFILFISHVLRPANSASERRPVTRSEVIPNPTSLKLAFPGISGPIPYERYGKFTEHGTPNFRFVISDKNGLAKAAGEGIFPNKDINRDPRYLDLLKQGNLEGSHWQFVDTRDSEVNFYKWATCAEDPGVKQFYTGLMFERLGLIPEAIKAYYAVLVHFPKTVSFTYYNTPWYLGPSTMDRIRLLIRRHPEIKLAMVGGEVKVGNKFDNDPKNDTFTMDPGQLIRVKKNQEKKPINLTRARPIKTLGGSRVQLRQYHNRHWQLFVNGSPFVVKGLTYSVTPIGSSPDRRTWNVSRDWQLIDTNHDDVHDGFFQSYLDSTCAQKKEVRNSSGDAKLLSDLGVNTFRAYHHLYNKELFRKLHRDHGFFVLCGDLLGAYAVGSGATWDVGTDYLDPSQQNRMLEGVRSMVEEYKDEPYILMWVLGNENAFADHANNAGKYPEAFYELVNRAAILVHELDPTRPVALANGDLLFLNLVKEKCPDIDVFGANVYRGEQGFGQHFFLDVKDMLDKPVLITEYGASAFAEGYSRKEAEDYQAMYIGNNWDDIQANTAGGGVGNAVGGVLFEWMDEWWKANADLPIHVQEQRKEWYAKKSDIYKNLQPGVHDQVPQFGFPFLDGWSYEEWYGIIGQGEGGDSPFCRVLKPAYHTLQHLWNK